MFDPIIADIEAMDIASSDLDLSVYLEIREDPNVVMVYSWTEFFREFWTQEMGDYDKAFNDFCNYWKAKDPLGFTFPGIKACTLANGKVVAHETEYNPSGIVSEQQVGEELYPSRLQREADYELHPDTAEKEAREYEYTGPWVSALMVQAKMERQERYEATFAWLSRHAESLLGRTDLNKEWYIKDLYRRFWKAYFQVQRRNEKVGYGTQSKPLTIEQRMNIKREFQKLAEIHEVDLVITWPEGERPKTTHDIIEDKKEQLCVLYESPDFADLAKAEELELEIQYLENRLQVDIGELAPWISEYITGTEREIINGNDS